MSREIKFRAWDGKIMRYENKEQFVIRFDGVIGSFNGETYDTVDWMLMQATGLKDKNGKDIYEGDICWTYETGIGNLNRVVVFDEGSFCLKHDYALNVELRGWKTDYIEVIGNIHQNHEILTKI